MDEFIYFKRICSSGHSSPVVPDGMLLPRKCPICKEPYDARYHPRIRCNANGDTPENVEDRQAENNATKNTSFSDKRDNEPDDKTINTDHQQDAGKSEKDNNGSSVPNYRQPFTPKRGRSVSVNEPTNPVSSSEKLHHGRQARTSSTSNPYADERTTSICLYSSGERIPIPHDGAILGRNGLGQEIFALNPLISRKHAFISINRFNEVQFRDEGSLNGSFADLGEGRIRLEPHTTITLSINTKIWLADQLLIIKGD